MNNSEIRQRLDNGEHELLLTLEKWRGVNIYSPLSSDNCPLCVRYGSTCFFCPLREYGIGCNHPDNLFSLIYDTQQEYRDTISPKIAVQLGYRFEWYRLNMVVWLEELCEREGLNYELPR